MPDMAHVDRDEAVSLGHVVRHQVQELARELDVQQRDPGDAELMGQDLGELGLVDQPPLDQEGPEPAPVGALEALLHLLQGEDLLQVLFSDQLGIDEELPEAKAGGGGHRGQVSPTTNDGPEPHRSA